MMNCHRCGGTLVKPPDNDGFIVCPTCGQSVHYKLWDQMQHALRAEHRMKLINSLFRGGNYTGCGATIDAAEYILNQLFGELP